MRRLALLVLLVLGSPASATPGHFAPAVPRGFDRFEALRAPREEKPRLIGRPRAPAFDRERRKLLVKNHDRPALRELFRIGHPGERKYGPHELGPQRRTPTPYWNHESAQEGHRAAISELLALDPHRKLASAAEWDQLKHGFENEQPMTIENARENIRFELVDDAQRFRDSSRLVERVRGQLAKRLADALAGHPPSPQALHQIAGQLAVEHPYLESPFRLEMMIADMRKVYPQLSAWDFRKHTDGKAFRDARRLPSSTQQLVTAVGRRAFAQANVLFVNHMYKDGLVMVDALEALGMDPAKARFVATPYPFDPRVRKALELRGIRTAAAPYSVEDTKRHVESAVQALLDHAQSNHGPIVVYDDGGLATEVIANKFARDLHRFRIIEITKSGERLGKAALANFWSRDHFDEAALPPEAREHVHQRFLDAHSSDGPSRQVAEQKWQNVLHFTEHAGGRPAKDRQIDSSKLGFAYYTYSNTPYKREAMTPLYTEQVNRSMFEAIARSKRQPINSRVAMIGGGAMGLSAARELRDQGHEVTFVETDPARAKQLEAEGFGVSDLRGALKGRGIVLEMSGMKNVIGLDQLHLVEDGAFLVHGSSKDNPFDMDSIGKMATRREAHDEHKGQRSATYHFEAAGITKQIHFLGDGFTISHGGKAQNVPLPKFLPELERLVNLGVYALDQQPITFYPVFTAPEHAMSPGTAAR